MAGTKRHGVPGTAMSRGELMAGFLYLPIYILVLPLLLDWLTDLLGTPLSDLTKNAVLFILNFLAVAILFRHFLWDSLRGIGRRFWEFVQAIILGFVFYYALAWFLTWLLGLLDLAVSNPHNDYINRLAGSGFFLMVICTVFLAPVVEETLIRGLIFGGIHEKSRVAAYAVSAILFAALHLWRYVGDVGWKTTLLCAVGYLPAGVALGWTYEKANTIWAAIAVHGLINAVALGILL